MISKDVLDIHPRKVCYFPATGKAMVKRLAASNPVSIVAQEKAALERVKPVSATGGTVDLF